MLRVKSCELFHHVFSLYITFSLLAFGLVVLVIFFWREKVLFYFVIFWGFSIDVRTYCLAHRLRNSLQIPSVTWLRVVDGRSFHKSLFLSLFAFVANPIKEPRERRPPSLPGFACLFVCCRHNDTYIYRRYSLPPVVQTLRVFICTLGLCFSSFRLSSRALYRGNFTALLWPFPDCTISP